MSIVENEYFLFSSIYNRENSSLHKETKPTASKPLSSSRWLIGTSCALACLGITSFALWAVQNEPVRTSSFLSKTPIITVSKENVPLKDPYRNIPADQRPGLLQAVPVRKMIEIEPV